MGDFKVKMTRDFHHQLLSAMFAYPRRNWLGSNFSSHNAFISTRLVRKPFAWTYRTFFPAHSPMPDNNNLGDEKSDLLFRYTSGRWLWSEETQLSARYVRFDIGALCQVAADSIGSRSCSDVTKLVEGNFNKVLLLTMDDGKEAIAKIPNPNAGRAHSVTSSEVATMDFVRDRLDIPAPKVFAWCSEASESKVGAEYIIMEKVAGLQLSKPWDDMEVMQKSEIVENIVRFEKSLASSPFCAYGSLYYSDGDASKGGQFTVGPTNNRKYFDDERNTLDLDRGPWSSAKEYVMANAKRERESITHLGPSPRLQGVFNGPDQYNPSNALKLHTLDQYLRLSPYLLPKNKETHKGVLWHPDLHTDNIFVDARDPTKITGVIDWQAVHIAPLFLQVRRPALLDFDGPIPERLKLPNLPKNFDELNPEEQTQATKLRDEQAMYVLYEIELLRQCRAAGSALHGRDTLVGRVTGLVGSIFTDGEPIVLGYLMQLVDRWKDVVGQDAAGKPLVPCPVEFTEDDRIKQREDQQKWQEGVELMDDVVQSLGAYSGWDGFVSHDDYVPMRRVKDSYETFLQRMAGSDEAARERWREAWPFPVAS